MSRVSRREAVNIVPLRLTREQSFRIELLCRRHVSVMSPHIWRRRLNRKRKTHLPIAHHSRCVYSDRLRFEATYARPPKCSAL